MFSTGLSLSACAFVPLSVALYQQHYKQFSSIFCSLPKTSLSLQETRVAHLTRLDARSTQQKPYFYIHPKLFPTYLYRSGLVLSLFLLLFANVPGRHLLHHFFAAVFAISSATFSTIFTLLHSTYFKNPPIPASLFRGLIISHCWIAVLALVQWVVIVLFSTLWIAVKVGLPYKLIPNKDSRFIALACLEYVGVSAFLTVVWIAGQDIADLRVGIRTECDREEIENGQRTIK